MVLVIEHESSNQWVYLQGFYEERQNAFPGTFTSVLVSTSDDKDSFVLKNQSKVNNVGLELIWRATNLKSPDLDEERFTIYMQ